MIRKYRQVKWIKEKARAYLKPEIKFKHEVKIKYGVGYSLDTEEITDTSLEWENRVKDRQFLNENKGKTASKIRVTYSNNDEGEQ